METPRRPDSGGLPPVILKIEIHEVDNLNSSSLYYYFYLLTTKKVCSKVPQFTC